MAKYDPLKEYLVNLPENQNEITLSFEQIEKIIRDKLPPAAYRHRAWWSNEKHGVHVNAHAWMDAGWKVDTVNLRDNWVRFVRIHQHTQVIPKNLLPIKSSRFTDRADKKTMFTANRLVKTLVIHKPGCRVIPWGKLDSCGCGDTGEHGNQKWFCEDHITREAVDKFMNRKFWAILMCDICF